MSAPGAAEIDAVALAVDGVERLYAVSAVGSALQSVRAVLPGAGDAPTAMSVVDVHEGRARVRLEVAIGGAAAADVARRVAAAVQEALDDPQAEVHVRIARVAPGQPRGRKPIRS